MHIKPSGSIICIKIFMHLQECSETMTQAALGHPRALQDNFKSLGNDHPPWESLELKVIFLMKGKGKKKVKDGCLAEEFGKRSKAVDKGSPKDGPAKKKLQK